MKADAVGGAWWAGADRIVEFGPFWSFQRKLGISRDTKREVLIAALVLADQEIKSLRFRLSVSEPPGKKLLAAMDDFDRRHREQEYRRRKKRSQGYLEPDREYDWLTGAHTVDQFRRATGKSDTTIRGYLRGEKPLKATLRGQRHEFDRATGLRLLKRWLTPQARKRSAETAGHLWRSALRLHPNETASLTSLRDALEKFHSCPWPRPPKPRNSS